jgi:glycosyltransferase involved in cell wall biosynthesis
MRKRLLFIKSRTASFIELDQQLLEERYDVHVIHQPGKLSDPRRLLRELLAADVIVGWWASWHTFLPFTLAWLLRKPSLLIVGGFDTAAEPELHYGYQLGGLRAHLSRFTMRRARVLMTNSYYSLGEVERNCGIPAGRVHVVYHGVPDEAGAVDTAGAGAGARADSSAAATAPPATAPATGEAATAKQPLALTVGIVDRTNLARKGLRAFVQAAALAPETQFVVAGKVVGDAGHELEQIAGENVRIIGWLEDDELQSLFARAGVYVQASLHEGFGVAVAEAMLHRCVPVVTRVGALPEVVGDTGVIVERPDPALVAAAVRDALAAAQASPDAGATARQRVLDRFSVDQRRDGLYTLVELALRR